MTNQSEARRQEYVLLQRAQKLDQTALATIHDQYYPAIYRYFTYRVNDLQTAEDLTSEVFTRFLHALHGQNAPQTTLRGWLYGTASFVLKEHYRQKKKSKHMTLYDDIPSSQPPLDNMVNQSFDQDTLNTAVQNLTADQQEVIALRFGYEMPIQEVANLMGKSLGSIKMLQARALNRLAKLLNAEASS
ncbi:MAG TPA: sigma-70 family RNA polymerase sigma factor [Anaerolineae bacterium]|nr:sigma-70 family RNA polymerase sigma factor [Anaerolineae bacterium]